MKHKIFIVDDHPLVKESLANLIHQQPDLEVCGDAADAPQALHAIGEAKPDVAIVDLSLGKSSGLELIKDLHRAYPDIAVLVLSMHEENFYAERVLRAGARGYVMKRESTKTVIAAIRSVLAGQVYLSETSAAHLAQRFLSRPTDNAESPVSGLSDRELEVFELTGRGLGTKHIADALHVSMKTVQTYHARIKEKLGLDSVTELLREALRWEEDKASARAARRDSR